MKKLISIITFVLVWQFCSAQFYNGLQQDFGKNRIQFGEKFWFYFRYQNFDVYFDKNGRNIAEYVAQNVDSTYAQMRKILEFDYSRRIVFVVYNTLSDFRQSNVGFSTSEDDYNVGGTTQAIDNKVILYFSGDHEDLNRQIRKGIAEVMVSEFLFGVGVYRKILSNSALATYPEWFFDGMTEHFSQPWASAQTEQICQRIERGNFKKITQLYGSDAIFIGYALWNYIASRYGSQTVSNMLYVSKVIRDIDETFLYVMGKPLQTVMEEMALFYTSQNPDAAVPQDFVKIPQRLTKRSITDIALSPNEQKLAFVTNKSGKLNIWIHDFETAQNQKIYQSGAIIEQITDYSYPVIQWHPTGKALAYFYEAKGTLYFALYNCETRKTQVREFHHFEKVFDFSYSTDGTQIVFSGMQMGQVDVFTYNIVTFANEQITNNIADERNPIFVQNDSKILFSSNWSDRNSQNKFLNIQSNYDLFLYSKNSTERLKSTPTNEQKPTEFEQGKFVYLTQFGKVQNLAETSLDSAVSYVDTAFHYNYFNRDFAVTNSSLHVQNYALAGNTLVQLNTINGKNYICKSLINQANFQPIEIAETPQLPPSDSVTQRSDSIAFDRQTANLYKTNFYINKLVNQIDLNFTSTGYQQFTGREYDYMQNLNVLLKLGIIDLFEDYRITGAYSFTGKMGSNEYLFSVENLRKRFDRQFVFHRQAGMTLSDQNEHIQRLQNNNFIYRLKFPFNQIQSVSVYPNFRHIHTATLAVDDKTLRTPSTNEFWGGLSANYVYDNVRKVDLNIYNGLRMKAFAECYFKFNDKNSVLAVLGFDARYYQKIHRNIILASRLAYSSSWGTSPLLYYLGSVDNWVAGQNQIFNNTIEYDRTKDWAFQAIATSMRGFSQNIRNGNSFVVANVELRVPIIQYLMVKPIRSEILKCFQVVGFADFGGAWSGLYPNAEPNAYRYSIIEQNPIRVEIDEMRQPFVFGYGYGFRTRLFGYYMRLDMAWGYDEGVVQRKNHLSIGMDF